VGIRITRAAFESHVYFKTKSNAALKPLLMHRPAGVHCTDDEKYCTGADCLAYIAYTRFSTLRWSLLLQPVTTRDRFSV